MSYNAAERLDIAHPADEEVRASLRLLLSRPEFNASARNRRFLTYIVEETLSGRATRIKAYGIALTVFQRADDFNPLIDPVVRIEAARLRRSLEHYYLTTGKTDRIRIDIPKGAYAASFAYTDGVGLESAVAAEEPAPAENVYQPPTIAKRRPWTSLALMLAALLVLPAGLIAYELQRGSPRGSDVASVPALSITVFPFENAVGDSDHAFVAHGLTYELIVRLTQIREMAVFGAGGARGGDSGKQTPLRAGLALFGSVRTEENSVRVTAVLANARTGQVLQSWSFERDSTTSSYPDLQSDVADEVVMAVRHLCVIDIERGDQRLAGRSDACRELASVVSN